MIHDIGRRIARDEVLQEIFARELSLARRRAGATAQNLDFSSLPSSSGNVSQTCKICKIWRSSGFLHHLSSTMGDVGPLTSPITDRHERSARQRAGQPAAF